MKRVFDITVPNFPLAAIWEITQKCNLHCVHCSSSGEKERNPHELSPVEALHVVDELATSLHIFRLVISGGEPLLRGDVFSIMSRAVSMGLKVSLFTNGTLLSDSVLNTLDEIGLDYLQIGISGLTDETHTLSQSKPLHTLFETAKKAKSFTFKVGISIPVHRKTFNEVLSKTDVLLDLELDSLCFSRFVPTGRGAVFAEELLLSREERRTLALFGQRLRDEGYSIILDEPLIDPSGCQAGISLCAISSTGDLYPCPLLRIIIGNVTSSPISELWQKSELIKNLKKRALKGECWECAHREPCGGCRAVAFFSTGDCLASDPQCWRIH